MKRGNYRDPSGNFYILRVSSRNKPRGPSAMALTSPLSSLGRGVFFETFRGTNSEAGNSYFR
jgi:hypothetical protein